MAHDALYPLSVCFDLWFVVLFL